MLKIFNKGLWRVIHETTHNFLIRYLDLSTKLLYLYIQMLLWKVLLLIKL